MTINNDGSHLIGNTETLLGVPTVIGSNGSNAILTFNQSLGVSSPINGTFAGSLSGSGLVVVEKGSVNFTGGPTNIPFSGILFAAPGGTITGNTDSLTGDIVDNGVVTFNQVAPGTYAGSISGSGSLIKEGIAPLTLKGVSPLTGQTTVKAGALSVQGGLPKSHVNVEKFAALKGTGKVGSGTYLRAKSCQETHR